MTDDPTKPIEAWFKEHCGDGEFDYPGQEVPFSVIGPRSSLAPIIVTSKPAIVANAVCKCERPDQFGMIGRYGLPADSDVGWFRELAGARELWFLGDMDPVDLMVFAWLRARLHPKQLLHLGVSDKFISALQIPLDQIVRIPCEGSELAAITALSRMIPDLQGIVGDDCARILMEGQKIELEAIVSAVGCAADLLRPPERLIG